MQAALQPALIPARPYHAASEDVISPMPAVLCTTGLSPSPRLEIIIVFGIKWSRLKLWLLPVCTGDVSVSSYPQTAIVI